MKGIRSKRKKEVGNEKTRIYTTVFPTTYLEFGRNSIQNILSYLKTRAYLQMDKTPGMR